jgi:hypothetical protein
MNVADWLDFGSRLLAHFSASGLATMNPVLMQSGWRHALAVLTIVVLTPLAVAWLFIDPCWPPPRRRT